MAARLQRLHDAGDVKAAFHVEQRRVVRGCRQQLGSIRGAVAQRLVGVFKLALNQGFQRGGGVCCGLISASQPGKANGRADLRRR